MFRQEESGHFAGTVSFADAQLNNSAIGNKHIKTDAADPIDAAKLQHQHAVTYHQADGSDIVAAIVPVYIVRGASGTVVSVEVSCVDAPSGGDKTFTVDILKASAGTPAPASILTAAVTYPNATPDCTVRTGTIASAAVADGDTLLVQVAVSGSTGVQGQGLVVTINLREKPE